MSLTCSPGSGRQAAAQNAPLRRAANWLSLAASPTFAAMALLAGVVDGETAQMLCSSNEAP